MYVNHPLMSAIAVQVLRKSNPAQRREQRFCGHVRPGQSHRTPAVGSSMTDIHRPGVTDDL